MNELILSDSEKEILDWMWERDKEYSYREIFFKFGEGTEKGWKKQTLSTFLKRMENKRVLSIRKEENKYFYKVSVNKQEYERQRAKYVLNSFFNGSLKQFMVSLNGGQRLNSEEAEELKKYLEE